MHRTLRNILINFVTTQFIPILLWTFCSVLQCMYFRRRLSAETFWLCKCDLKYLGGSWRKNCYLAFYSIHKLHNLARKEETQVLNCRGNPVRTNICSRYVPILLLDRDFITHVGLHQLRRVLFINPQLATQTNPSSFDRGVRGQTPVVAKLSGH